MEKSIAFNAAVAKLLWSRVFDFARLFRRLLITHLKRYWSVPYSRQNQGCYCFYMFTYYGIVVDSVFPLLLKHKQVQRTVQCIRRRSTNDKRDASLLTPTKLRDLPTPAVVLGDEVFPPTPIAANSTPADFLLLQIFLEYLSPGLAWTSSSSLASTWHPRHATKLRRG